MSEKDDIIGYSFLALLLYMGCVMLYMGCVMAALFVIKLILILKGCDIP